MLKYPDIRLPNGYVYPGFNTPEIDRTNAIKAESNIIAGFVQWFENRKMRICKVDNSIDRYTPIGTPIEKFMAEYFKIDLEVVEHEKREILAYIRVQAGGDPSAERDELGLSPIKLKKFILKRNRAKRPARVCADGEEVPY